MLNASKHEARLEIRSPKMAAAIYEGRSKTTTLIGGGRKRSNA